MGTGVVVGYLRLSRDAKHTGSASIEAQKQAIRAYAEAKGLGRVRWAEDVGQSGGKPFHKRPGGSAVLRLAEAGALDAMIATKVDRVGRDLLDCLTVVERLKQASVSLHLLDVGGQSIGTDSPTGAFFLQIMGAFAELERRIISERIRDAKAFRREQGLVHSRAAFGARHVGGKALDDPAERAIIDEILAKRSKGWSYRRLAEHLNASGVPCKQGGQRWYAATVRNIVKREKDESG